MKHIYYYPTLSAEEVDELQKYVRQPITKQEYRDLARFLHQSAKSMSELVGLSPGFGEAMEEEYKYKMALAEKLEYIEMKQEEIKVEIVKNIKPYMALYEQAFSNNPMYNPNESVDSCEMHSMCHEDTEILGQFCDVAAIHGDELKDLLIRGWVSKMLSE